MLRELLGKSTGLLCGVTLFLGCHVKVDSQVVLAVHDVEDDRLEFVFVHRGIMASEAGKVVSAREELTPMIEGARTFGFGWPLTLELDRLAPTWSESDQELAAGVTLLSHTLFLDEEGRLSGYQHVEVLQLQAALARVNEAINKGILSELQLSEDEREPQVDPPESDDDEFPLTAARWLAAAQEDWTWISIDKGVLVIRAPFDQTEQAKALVELKEAPAAYLMPQDGAAESYSAVLKDNVYTVTFAPDADGIFAIHSESQSDREWEPDLMESLPRATRLGIRKGVTQRMLRALLVGD